MASECSISASLQEDHGTYVVRGRIYDSDTGKYIQRSKSTGLKVKDNTKRAAEKAMREIVAEWEKDASKPKRQANPLFEEYVYNWINKKRLSLKPNSIKSYIDYANAHIIPSLGHIKIRSLNLNHLNKFYESFLKDHTVSSAKKVHVVISGAILDAVREGMIPNNFSQFVEFPRAEKFEGKAYTPEQVALLLDEARKEGEPINAAITLAVCYGLRRSEIVGLRWSDIDFKNGTMTISNTVTQNGKLRIEMERTKTRKSHRTLSLIEYTVPYLKELRAAQERHGLHSDKVCVWPDGRECRPDYLTATVSRVMKNAGLPPIRVHDLRHTAASMLAEYATAKQVQDFLGHEDVSTTLNVYTHLSDKAHQQTSEYMNQILTSSNISSGFCSESCSESKIAV